MITLIWAQDIKKGIGIDNLLPWRIKEEMDHFRKQTLNKIVVMGQKTFESIGKPLVNRTNYVLSNDPKFSHEGVKTFHELNSLLLAIKGIDVMIIGGKSIYELFAPLADCLIVSKIKRDYNCNRFMEIDFSNFHLVKKEEHEVFTAEWWQRKK